MSHLDIEITQLKAETIKMWELVNIQLKKGREALINLDKDLAREIVLKERRVNAYELAKTFSRFLILLLLICVLYWRYSK